jgi:hypothetical protein
LVKLSYGLRLALGYLGCKGFPVDVIHLLSCF